MIERDMEDLIASYPDDFFPGRGFEIQGRQGVFAGVGRYDLLFQDRFKTMILMELKAVTAKYEVATQLAKYKDELRNRGENHILMWLVAPQVPHSVREFLDRIGIEYSEIHEVEFRRVAELRGISIASEKQTEVRSGQTKPSPPLIREPVRRIAAGTRIDTGPIVTSPSGLRWKAYGYDLSLMNPQSFNAAGFADLVTTFERAVPGHRNASLVAELARWAANPSYLRWPHKSNASLLRWVTTSSYRSAVPTAMAIWNYLFGEPAPTWHVWNQSAGCYEFKQDEWRVWFGSLNPL
jgi:hypothetical protein